MKLILTLILISCTLLCSAQKQSLNSRISADSAEISSLKQQVKILQNSIEQSNNLTSIGSSTIANQLSSSSVQITVFGFLLTILLFSAGFYITRIETRTAALEKRTGERLVTIEGIEKRIVEIQRDIKTNTKSLYLQLQREEIEEMISKIQGDPSSIIHFSDRLYPLGLSIIDFNRLYDVLKLTFNKDGFYNVDVLLPGLLFKKFPIEMITGDSYFQPRNLSKSTWGIIANFLISESDSNKYPHLRTYLKEIIIGHGYDSLQDALISKLTKIEIDQLLTSKTSWDSIADSELLIKLRKAR